MTIDQQFNTINEKLKHLLKQHQQLKKENQSLKEQLEQHALSLAGKEQSIHQLQEKISLLKMAGGEMNEKDKQAFERKINAYIRAIDKCIDQLSQ